MTTIVKSLTAGDESGRERDVVVPLSGKQRRQRRGEMQSQGRKEREEEDGGKGKKKERESKGEERIRDAVRNQASEE